MNTKNFAARAVREIGDVRMTILGIDPGNYQLRWPKGSPYLLRLKFSKGEGGFLDLTGRVLRFAAYRAGGKIVHDAPIVIKGDTGSVLFDGSVSLIAGLDGASWQVAQVFDEGATPLFRGSIYVSAAASSQGTGAGTPPSDLLIWDPAPQTLIVSSIGTPGISPWEAAGQTFEEYDAAIRAPLLDAVAGVTQQVGASITELGEATSEKFAEVDDHIALKVGQVDGAITELGEATSDKFAEVDDHIALKDFAIDAAIGEVLTAGAFADDRGAFADAQGKFAKAQGEAIGDIAGAVAVTGAAKLATEKARDQVALTAAGLRFDLASTFYTPWGKKVAFSRVDPSYGVGDLITEEGVHHANYSIRVNGATWTRGSDGFWTLDLSALALAKYSFPSGDVIDGTKTRYYKGNKVNWAVVDANFSAAICVTADGKTYIEDLVSPATDITKAVFPQLTFNTGETIVASTVTKYYNGQPVSWARTDKDGRASIVELTSGKVVIPDFESPALDLAGGTAALETANYVFTEAATGGSKQILRFSKRDGRKAAATSTGNNFAARLSLDGTKLVYLSDRSGVKESWYQLVSGSKFGGSVEHPVLPRLTITPAGDSLTAGGYADLVAAAFGTTLTSPSSVSNDGTTGTAGGGIGSQQANQVAARYGAAADLTCALANNTMVDGANLLTAISIGLISRAGDQPNSIRTLRASLLGVSGLLRSVQQAAAGGGALPQGGAYYVYTFTPDVGQALPAVVPAGTQLIIDPENRQDSILLCWVGRNNVGSGVGWQDEVKARIASMVAAHKPLLPRFIVIGVTNAKNEPAGSANYNAIVALNLELAALYGDNFVDVRPTYNAGTATDIPSDANTVDDIHYNNTGRAAIANVVIARITAKGWFS